MAENLSVESPDFDKIRKESGTATSDAIRLLWYVTNNEIADRRRGVREAQEKREGKVLSAAPASAQDNFDAQGAFLVVFTGSTAFNLTGIRNGLDGRCLLIHVTGTGTVTVKNESASSDAANRIDSQSGADLSVTTGKTLILNYYASRWREAKLV